jgi:phage/plasmid primase-like uncharacterized protein
MPMSTGVRSAAYEAWVDRARGMPVEDEVARRGIKLSGNGTERAGPCPRCGGTDRFSINTKKQVWNCRKCGVGGDVIKLVEHVDGGGFIVACQRLTREPPPRPNRTRKVVTKKFEYCDEKGTLAFVVERVESQNPDGTFVLTKEGKHEKTFRQKRPKPEGG